MIYNQTLVKLLIVVPKCLRMLQNFLAMLYWIISTFSNYDLPASISVLKTKSNLPVPVEEYRGWCITITFFVPKRWRITVMLWDGTILRIDNTSITHIKLCIHCLFIKNEFLKIIPLKNQYFLKLWFFLCIFSLFSASLRHPHCTLFILFCIVGILPWFVKKLW